MSNELFHLANQYRQVADWWLARLNESPDSPWLEEFREVHRQTAFRAAELKAEAQDREVEAAAFQLSSWVEFKCFADEAPLVRANLDKQHSTKPKPAEPYVWHAKIAPEPPLY